RDVGAAAHEQRAGERVVGLVGLGDEVGRVGGGRERRVTVHGGPGPGDGDVHGCPGRDGAGGTVERGRAHHHAGDRVGRRAGRAAVVDGHREAHRLTRGGGGGAGRDAQDLQVRAGHLLDGERLGERVVRLVGLADGVAGIGRRQDRVRTRDRGEGGRGGDGG